MVVIPYVTYLSEIPEPSNKKHTPFFRRQGSMARNDSIILDWAGLLFFERICSSGYMWKVSSITSVRFKVHRRFNRRKCISYRTVNRYCIPSLGSSLKSSGRFATGRICLPKDSSSSSESSNSSLLRLNGIMMNGVLAATVCFVVVGVLSSV